MTSLLKRFLEVPFSSTFAFYIQRIDNQAILLCSVVPQRIGEVSHSHCQVYLAAFLSRSMEVQGDGSSSLRPEHNSFNRSLYGVFSPLGSKRGMKPNVV